MFRKILIPTDFSREADGLLRCLGKLAPLGFEEVVLLHVTDVRFAVNILGFDAGFYDRHDSLAAQKLEDRRREMEKAGHACRIAQIHDVPAKGIIHMADKEGCDLIFIASRGHGALADSLLGSTATYVVEHSHVPVLILRMSLVDDVCLARPGRLLDHVLYATDFSVAAHEAFQALKDMARNTGKITLFHVNVVRPCDHPAMVLPEAYGKEDADRLQSLALKLKEVGAREVSVEIEEGCVKQLLAERSRAEDVSLLIMGTRGWGRFKEILLGSVARTAVQMGGVPVLLVREFAEK